MSIVPRNRRSGKITYYVVFAWNGKDVWERSGTDKREARALERKRKQEVLDGAYSPDAVSAATLVRQYAVAWGKKRLNRNAAIERGLLRDHVLERSWFADMALVDVRPKHLRRLVDELTAAPTNSPKSVSNIYGVVRTMFRDAIMDELIAHDPCVLPKGYIKRQRREEPVPYTKAEAMLLIHAPSAPWDLRVFAALALYTGMRQGEVCGRRWRDLDESPEPMACLTVRTQYKDLPLKTDNPRKIPVHPELAAILREWRATGFELHFLRAPQPDDPIVPMRFSKRTRTGLIRNHTKSSSYKAFVKLCGAAGVDPGARAVHRTRNSFITWARRDGARKEVIERVTHNAKGDIVDQYTAWDWAPLCEAVACLRLDVRRVLSRGGDPSGNSGGSGVQYSTSSTAESHGSLSSLPGSIPSASTTKYLEKGSSKKTRQTARQAPGRRKWGVQARLRECVQLATAGTPGAEEETARHLARVVRFVRKAAPAAVVPRALRGVR